MRLGSMHMPKLMHVHKKTIEIVCVRMPTYARLCVIFHAKNPYARASLPTSVRKDTHFRA